MESQTNQQLVFGGILPDDMIYSGDVKQLADAVERIVKNLGINIIGTEMEAACVLRRLMQQSNRRAA
jgi:hypothetical protein